MSKHTTFAGLEFKSVGNDDPALAEVKTALEGLTADVNTKTAPVADIEKRLGALEAKSARPNTTENKDGEGVERKALAAYARTNDDTELKALSVGSDPDGGYLALPTVEAGIRTIARDTSPLRALASTVTIGTDTYDILLDVSDVEAAWVGETEARPETDGPGFIKSSIVVHEMYAAPRATQKILDDASLDIGGWLEGKIGTRFGAIEATAFSTGDGVGKPRGYQTYSTAATGDFTRAWGTLQHVAAGATAPTDVQLSDALVRLSLTLRVPYRPGAAWLMSRETAVRLRQIRDTTGAYIWQPGLLENSPDRLLGFPVQYDDSMPAIGENALPIALADWKAAYQIVDRHGIRVIRDNLTVKPYTIFYSYKRVGGDVVDFNALKFLKISAA